MNNVCLYFILFMIYSFLGWLMEVIQSIINDHKFVNRGFLIGPYCPIYGYGAVSMILLLNNYLSDPLILFMMAIFICSFLEYFTSYFMEKLFNARWWDYSEKKFNLNGRICLETMIPFGMLGMLIMYVVNPFLVKMIKLLPSKVIIIVAIILFIIYIVDNILSFTIIKSFKNEIKRAEKDQTEEITKRIRKILTEKSIFHRRLLGAFPKLMTKEEFLSNIRKSIDEKLKKRKSNK